MKLESLQSKVKQSARQIVRIAEEIGKEIDRMVDAAPDQADTLVWWLTQFDDARYSALMILVNEPFREELNES